MTPSPLSEEKEMHSDRINALVERADRWLDACGFNRQISGAHRSDPDYEIVYLIADLANALSSISAEKQETQNRAGATIPSSARERVGGCADDRTLPIGTVSPQDTMGASPVRTPSTEGDAGLTAASGGAPTTLDEEDRELLAWLDRASRCVYLTAEKDVADSIRAGLTRVRARLSALLSQLDRDKVIEVTPSMIHAALLAHHDLVGPKYWPDEDYEKMEAALNAALKSQDAKP